MYIYICICSLIGSYLGPRHPNIWGHVMNLHSIATTQYWISCFSWLVWGKALDLGTVRAKKLEHYHPLTLKPGQERTPACIVLGPYIFQLFGVYCKGSFDRGVSTSWHGRCFARTPKVSFGVFTSCFQHKKYHQNEVPGLQNPVI